MDGVEQERTEEDGSEEDGYRVDHEKGKHRYCANHGTRVFASVAHLVLQYELVDVER